MGNPFFNLEDEKLMELYLNDNFQAFEVIYDRYKGKVYTYLERRLNQDSLKEEIFQNIFAKFHSSRHLYDPKYLLLKWIYTICRSELLDFKKKNHLPTIELKEEFLLAETPQEIDFDIESEASLSTKEKEAIKLRYFSDQDFEDISNLLNTSQSNARKLVSRGLNKLRTKYKGSNNE